jgi:DNA topoisomerase-1
MLSFVQKIKKSKTSNVAEYYVNDKLVTEEHGLLYNRIRKLRVPPAWTSVRIAKDPCNYLQVVGQDIKGRTQYIYHPEFVKLTQREKFTRVKNLAKHVEILEKKIDSMLRQGFDRIRRERPAASRTSLMALITKIMLLTYVRVGSEHQGTAFGLTTLQKRHIKLSSDGTIILDFIGKKGVRNYKEFKNNLVREHLIELYKRIKNPEGRFFMDADGVPITCNDINNFIRDTTLESFSCKDIRTLASNIVFIKMLCNGLSISDAYVNVAKELCNTKYVSKKSYVMIQIEDLYKKNPQLFNKSANPLSIIQKL